MSQLANEAHRRAARRWQLAQREEGNCVICGDEAVTADYCERHREQVNDNQRKRFKSTYAARRAAKQCVQCVKPTDGSAYCNGCLDDRARRRASAA